VRAPWQRMSGRNLEIINFFLWLISSIIALLPASSNILYEFTGFIKAAFDLCILPGLFYYLKNSDSNYLNLYKSFYIIEN
jgi:hypothetical protein